MKEGEDYDDDNHPTCFRSSDAESNSPEGSVGSRGGVPPSDRGQPGRCKLAVALTWLTGWPWAQPSVKQVVQASSVRMAPDPVDTPSCGSVPSEGVHSVPSMRELHAANTRNRRISIVAALSPQDLRAWQACGESRAGFESATAPAHAQQHEKSFSSEAVSRGASNDLADWQASHSRQLGLGMAAIDGPDASHSPEDSRYTSKESEASGCAETCGASTCLSDTSAPACMSLRQLHEANTRNRRLGLVAALSPGDLRAWQADSVRAAVR